MDDETGYAKLEKCLGSQRGVLWKLLDKLKDGLLMTPAVTTETRATAVVLLGIAIAIFSNDNLLMYPSKPLILYLGLAVTIILTLISSDTITNKYFRRNAEIGILCCPLLPVCKLLSRASGGIESPASSGALEEIFLQGSFIASLIVVFCVYTKNILERNRVNTSDLVFMIISVVILITACVLLMLKMSRYLDMFQSVVCLTVLLAQSFVHFSIPRWLPRSFTLGEAAVASQGIFIFFMSAGSLYLKAWEFIVMNKALSSSTEAVLFIQTAVLSCILVNVLVFLIPFFRSNVGYYILVPGVAATFSFPILNGYLGGDFVTWCYNYICKNHTGILLFCYWFTSCLAATATVYFNGSGLVIKSLSPSKDENGGNPQVSTAVRKQFHFLATAILLPGLLLDVEILFMASSCAFVVLVMLESVRILRIFPVGETLDRYFQVFADDRDEGKVILTHIYLLVGCSLPLWLHRDFTIHIALCSGLLALGIGDTLASVAGSKFGRWYWPDTKKTVEGTTCAVLGQFCFLLLLYVTGLFAIPWTKCAVAIVLTSLLEAFTTQIDNLLLPIFMYILLI